MENNLVSLEVEIDVSQFVGLEAVAKEKGGQTVSQLLSSFLSNWVSAYPVKAINAKRGEVSRRRVA